MKAIIRSQLRLICRTASGPFSYLAWPNRQHMTVHDSIWVDNELVIIEQTAPEYLRAIDRNTKITWCLNTLEDIKRILHNCNVDDVNAIRQALEELKLELDIRYDNNVSKYKGVTDDE